MYSEFSLVMSDKSRTFMRSFLPEAPKAVVILIHGKGEHGGRYLYFGTRLDEAGYAVYAPDLRGHGQTDGKRGHTAPRRRILDDIDEVITYAKMKHPALPVFMYGHSMGGNIALSYRMQRGEGIRAFVISSPWLHLKGDFAQPLKSSLCALSNVAPRLAFKTGIDPTVISSKSDEQQEYLKDKGMNGVITAQTLADVFRTTKQIEESAQSCKYPFMLLHGGDDRLVDVEGSRSLAKLSGDICEYHEYAGNRHEILHDLSRDEAISDMITFLDKMM